MYIFHLSHIWAGVEMDFGERLNILKRLFNPQEIGKLVEEEKKRATLRDGVLIFALGVMLGSIFSFIMNILYVFALDSMIESLATNYIIANKPIILTHNYLVNAVISFLLVGIPALFIGTFIAQKAVYKLLKALGGKAEFFVQYYLTSNVTLLQSLLTPLLFLVFLPCINVIVLLVFIAVGMYLTLYVQGKMYVDIHNVSWPAAIGATLLAVIMCSVIYIGAMMVLDMIGLFPRVPPYIEVAVGTGG